MEGQENIVDLAGNGERRPEEAQEEAQKKTQKESQQENEEKNQENNETQSNGNAEKQNETKNQVDGSNQEPNEEEEATIGTASLQERRTAEERRTSPSSLAKPWLSYARAVCRGLQGQLNSADRTLSSMVESRPDNATIRQLREGQRAAMKKVLKELNNLTEQAANIEQSCLRPKLVKQSVDKSKSAGKNNTSKWSASKPVQERPDQPLDQPMDVVEETGQPATGSRSEAKQAATSSKGLATSSERLVTSSEQPSSSEQPVASTEQLATSSEQLATSSEQLPASSEQPANPTETLSSIVQNEFKCSICQELMVNATNLSCSHVFCKCCIDEWLDKNRRCPVCRKGVRSSSKRHHVLPIDNFLQLYFSKFGTGEQQAERNRLISERRSREVIVIEDDSPTTDANQSDAGHFVYSLGLAMDSDFPRTRNRHRNRRRRRRENSLFHRLRRSRVREMRENRERENRERENRERANLSTTESAGGQNAVQSNDTPDTLANSPPVAVNSSAPARQAGNPIEVITGRRTVVEQGTIAERRTAPEQRMVVEQITAAEQRRQHRTPGQRTTTRLPTPIVRDLPMSFRSRRTVTRPTQTEAPVIEILPILELDELDFDGLEFDEMVPMGIEIDVIELDESEQSVGSASDAGRVGRTSRLRRIERSRRSRRHRDATSNELTSNSTRRSRRGLRSEIPRRRRVEMASDVARPANPTSTNPTASEQTSNDGATGTGTTTDRTISTISSPPTDRTRTDQTKTDQSRTDQTRTDRVRTDRVKTDRKKSKRSRDDATRKDRKRSRPSADPTTTDQQTSRRLERRRSRRLRPTAGTPNRPSVNAQTPSRRTPRRLNNESTATISGTSERPSSVRLSRSAGTESFERRMARQRARREERRRARHEERRQARRARRLDINDHVLGRKHPH